MTSHEQGEPAPASAASTALLQVPRDHQTFLRMCALLDTLGYSAAADVHLPGAAAGRDVAALHRPTRPPTGASIPLTQ
jgi:hypothetical protein